MRKAGMLVAVVVMCAVSLSAVASASTRSVATPQSTSTNCFDAFGPGAGPQGGDGCVSLISDSSGYCLSSGGRRDGGPVRQEPCSRNNADEVWWVTQTGANGTFEIWNAGSSCPSSLAWDSCGTPYGAQPQGNGYCLSVKGVRDHPGAKLVMWGCKQGGGASTSWEGAGTPSAAWLEYQRKNPHLHYCASSLNHAAKGDRYGIEPCSTTPGELFSGGTFGDKTVSVTPPTSAPDPR